MAQNGSDNSTRASDEEMGDGFGGAEDIGDSGPPEPPPPLGDTTANPESAMPSSAPQR